jgi:hypothetical protein
MDNWQMMLYRLYMQQPVKLIIHVHLYLLRYLVWSITLAREMPVEFQTVGFASVIGSHMHVRNIPIKPISFHQTCRQAKLSNTQFVKKPFFVIQMEYE